MSNKSILMTRILINRYHGGEHPCLDSLPEEEKGAIEECGFESEDVASILSHPLEKLGKVHYSWLVDPLKQADPEILPLLLQSLPSEVGKKLAKMLGVDSLEGTLPRPIAHLIAERLYTVVGLGAVKSAAFLPKQPLGELLTLTKSELVDLIDCLAMADISVEIPQIVDREKLGKLVEALRPVQQQYLKSVLHYKGKWQPPKLGIDQWGGNRDKLGKALHLRGVSRLALALGDHDKEWVHYLIRRFDTGRGDAIEKRLVEGEDVAVIKSLQLEVLKAIEFLRKYGKTE